MKFKIKLDNDKKIIQADNLEDLHSKVITEFGLTETAILSLNGRDPIQSVGSLSDAGLVGGDILKVITIEQPPPNVINENDLPSSSSSQSPSNSPSAPLTFEELISKLRLTKITENIYSYESDGTIMITSNKIDSMEIFNIGKGQNSSKVGCVFLMVGSFLMRLYAAPCKILELSEGKSRA